MKAIEFPQQTDILAKDQPQYQPLPVYVEREPVDWIDDDGIEHTTMVPMEMTCCFELEPDELAQVIATGKLYYTQCVMGKQFQPIRMSVVNPFGQTVLSSEWGSEIAKLVVKVFQSIDSPMEEKKDQTRKFIQIFMPGLLSRREAKPIEKPPLKIRQVIQQAIVDTRQLPHDKRIDVANKTLEIYNRMECAIVGWYNEGRVTAITEQSPIRSLVEALQGDPGYRNGWQANLAMAFKDAYERSAMESANDEVDFNPDINQIANDAATNFINSIINNG